MECDDSSTTASGIRVSGYGKDVSWWASVSGYATVAYTKDDGRIQHWVSRELLN